MPLIQIDIHSAASIDMAAVTPLIAADVTDLTATILRKRREVTAVHIRVAGPATWFIGGQATERSTFALTIKVTTATNSKEEKASYVAGVFAAMERHLGALEPASYVLVEDVGAESWGFGGLTQEHRFIASRLAAA